jgi:hypothetical protein
MTARVLIHPRCLHGPASGALEATLQSHGFVPNELAVGPPSGAGHCDLVRLVDKQGSVLTLERMDAVRFKHVLQGGPAPEAA